MDCVGDADANERAPQIAVNVDDWRDDWREWRIGKDSVRDSSVLFSKVRDLNMVTRGLRYFRGAYGGNS
jgi:hypothetical protein